MLLFAALLLLSNAFENPEISEALGVNATVSVTNSNAESGPDATFLASIMPSTYADYLSAFFFVWFGYNQIFFHHCLMDNVVDKVFHSAIGMAHDVMPSNNVSRTANLPIWHHFLNIFFFCGGPSPYIAMLAAYMGYIQLPSWFFIGMVMGSYVPVLCHMSHRSIHQLNFNPDNYGKSGLKLHERMYFYPVHLLCQIGILNCYDGHYKHHYTEERGQITALKALRLKEDRGGFAMFATTNTILSWTLSLTYVDRDAYAFGPLQDYALTIWTAGGFALRLYGLLFDRMLLVAFMQWAFLVFVKLSKPDFKDITINAGATKNYEVLQDEKRRVFSGAVIDEKSKCVGVTTRLYDATLRAVLGNVVGGENEEWKRKLHSTKQD